MAILVLAGGFLGCRPVTPTMRAAPAAGGPETLKESWPDGSPKTSRQVVRGPEGTPILHGLYTSWYESGSKQYEATYVNGQLDGTATAWHPNGQVWTTEEYVKGLRHGTRLAWNQGGRLVQEEHYFEDQPDGTWTIWGFGGAVKWQGRFDKGKPLP